MVHRGDRTNSCGQRGPRALPFVQRGAHLSWYEFGPRPPNKHLQKAQRGIQETGT